MAKETSEGKWQNQTGRAREGKHTALRWAMACWAVACLLLALPRGAEGKRRLRCEVYTAKALQWVKRATRRHVRDCLKHRWGCPDALADARIGKIAKRAARRINKRCPRADAILQARSAELDVLCNEYGLCADFGTMSMRVLPSLGPASKSGAAGLSAQGAGTALAAVRADAGTTGLAHDLSILQGAGFESRLLNCG